MSFFARIWACSRRGRRAVTLACASAAWNASRTTPLARSPMAWTFCMIGVSGIFRFRLKFEYDFEFGVEEDANDAGKTNARRK